MRHPLQLVFGLLASLAVASALPALFPRDNITTYRYSADVRTGTIEPTPFASQFVLSGWMHIAPELSDPKLKNAFYVFLNVTHGVRNGEMQNSEEELENTLELPDAAKMLNDPFVVIFDDNGRMKSMMMNEKEAGWSQNMKKSMASMVQLDLSSMHLESEMKPHGFLTKENTIYGECAVAYDVHHTPNDEENHFTVTKNMNPMSCSMFRQHEFNSMESEECLIENEEEMTSASRRDFHIENTGESLLIKKLVAYGVINYFPWRARSEAHFIIANQTMEFESMMPMGSMMLPELDMKKMMTLDNIAFKKSESSYGVNAGVDHTFGRHIINPETMITKLTRMLGEAADYMNENNLEMTSPEMKHGQTMNRILDTMSRMDLPSIEIVFNNILEGTTPKDCTIKNVFLGMVPYVGTNATCLFTRNIIRKRKIEDTIAITMMTKLPFNIRVPSDSLLMEMEDFMRLGDDMPLEIRKAAMLCFANMIRKTHEHVWVNRAMDHDLVDKYVKHYHDCLMNEPAFEMKMVCLMAMTNIEIGNVHKLLEPIIRGDLKVSDRPDHLRLHAMMANRYTVRDFEYIHDLYWPILSNTELPLELRLCAYTILINQPPRMERLMNLYWFMVNEKNEHMYNYHYTTMKSLANSVSPCMTPMMEMARKIMRFMRVRPVTNIRTGMWLVDYMNKEFGFGDSIAMTTVANEHTGFPYITTIRMTSLSRRKPVNRLMFWLRIEGLDDILRQMKWTTDLENPNVPVEQILNLLKKASKDRPSNKPIHIEFAIMVQGRTVYAKHLDSLPKLEDLMSSMMKIIAAQVNSQAIIFDELYTMQVPNDLGLPSLLHNRVPHVVSLHADNEIISQKAPNFSMRVEAMIKVWRHGYYSMEVYNPIMDSWHAIRRVSAYDMSLPTMMSISYNQDSNTLKLTLPRLPLTQFSTSGVRSHVKNYVMITDVDDDILERHCKDCRQAELVTRGTEYRKNMTLMNIESKCTGLRLSAYRYDCERDFKQKSAEEIYSKMSDKHNLNTETMSRALMLRAVYLRTLIDPEVGTCGFMARIEPSIMYPMSQIDISMRMNNEVPVANMLSLYPAMKLNLRATVEAKAAATDIPVETWTMTANLGATQGLINQQMQIQITRKTPDQPDLKVCIDGSKLYPATEADPLNRVITTKQEVIGKLTMTMGEPVNGTCPRDGMSIMMNMKGEMSDEQIDALKREMAEGMCRKDMENPLYMYTESSIVPRTAACLRETMLRTLLRKYTFTVFYRNIPDSVMPWFDSMLRKLRSSTLREFHYLPAHTEPGMMKIFIEYPLNNEMNLILRTPTHEEKYMGLTTLDFPGTNASLESTRFSQEFVKHFEKEEMRFCSIYPEILLNADGAVMPFVVPQQWTLLTGEYRSYSFSVFVKRLEPKKLGLLMSVQNHTIEVIPSATVPTVTVDGKVIDYVNGVRIPDNELYALRTTWNHNRLVIQSKITSFNLEWTERSVTLAMDLSLQGRVTGLCGHLDGTHMERMAKVYTFEQ